MLADDGVRLPGARRYALARKAASDKGADEEEVASQVNTVLDVLKSFRTITVEGYIENDVYVEHSLVEIRDIEE